MGASVRGAFAGPGGLSVTNAQFITCPASRSVEVTLRAGAGAGARGALQDLEVGQVVRGRVKRVERYGVFVEARRPACKALRVMQTQRKATLSVPLFERAALLAKPSVGDANPSPQRSVG